jgi:TonB family protein
MTDSPNEATFGLLPRPEGRKHSFVISTVVNLVFLGVCFFIGAMAPRVIERHFEETQLIAPTSQPPVIRHPRPKPRIVPPHMERPKPAQTEARLKAPPIPQAKPRPALTRQPKPALAAAMPAQNQFVHPSVKPVHLGDTFGVRPNPNAMRPATVAAIGNPYGGMEGPAIAPHGVVRSAGFGESTRAGAGGGGGGSGGSGYGTGNGSGEATSVEIVSRPPAEYNASARQLRIEGDVVLSVTFLADGRVEVHGVIRGLGHGLDEEAIRVAQQMHFRPATRNGRPVDVNTHVTISFQLA